MPPRLACHPVGVPDAVVADPRGDEATVAAIERWFVRRGTPHLIEDYSASEDILTRSVPWFTLVFLAEAALVLEVELAWWQNLLFALGGFALLLGVWVLANLARRHPPLARPAHVGTVELAIFVLGPALPPLLLNGRPGQAAGVVVANLVLLGAAFVVTSYGLLPLTRWAFGRMLRELSTLAGLLARALPMLLLFVTFLFVNTEVWQVAEALERPFLIGTVLLFVALGGVFLVTRLPGELQGLATFHDDAEVDALCEATPAERVAGTLEHLDEVRAPLTRRQRVNVSLVVVFSQAVQVTLVAVLIAGFFVAFGALAIRPDVIESWVGEEALAEDVVRFTIGGNTVVVTAALLRVATFLGAFSGFYFAVYTVTDATYREQFHADVVAEVRQTFAVRAAYLALRRRRAAAGGA